MIYGAVITLVACATLLIAQRQAHKHEQDLRAGRGRFAEFSRRLKSLEESDRGEIDPASFEDIKTKVEALRLAQGLRR